VAYRYKMMAPRFPYMFPNRDIDANYPHMMLEHNRCIQCLRCVRGIRTKDDEPIFGFVQRGHRVRITIDPKHIHNKEFTAKRAQEAMDICPVGAILKKGNGFSTPIGERKYDNTPIGNEIESMNGKGK
jgi:[NiFe] hydrogenase diaphorase moiety small subunit